MALKALVLLVLLGTAAAAAAAKRLNVLMVAIDDLRTEISPYPEGAHMHTPAFQKLASESVVFERCYVQVAVCAASRTALLTSRWPDTSKTWTIEDDQYWRFTAGNFTTLPQLFKEAGCEYASMGAPLAFCLMPAGTD
jgi:iduronate 2-sulfatase